MFPPRAPFSPRCTGRSLVASRAAKPASGRDGLHHERREMQAWPAATFAQMQHVLVLNASYEPLNVCSTRRAHVLVWKGKAEVVERLDEPLRTATNTYVRPHVIRLVSYVRVPQSVKRRISRRALFARDGWRCAYCGDSSSRLTLDHVVPRSRGGDSVWENVVTACAACNLRKADRLLEETHMRLLRPPRPPAPVLFISLALHAVPETWRQYLPGLEEAATATAAA